MSYHNIIDINVLVNGRRCKQYSHQGKKYIESKDGSKYTLEVKNNTGKRVLVVSSVDGLNVLNGENASPSDTGYIIPAYSKIEIKGFRHSDEGVGAFEFTRKGDNDSYAATKGDQRNVGVIGFRIFDEVYRPPKVIKEVIYQPYPVWPKSNPWWDYPWYTTCCSDDGLGFGDVDYERGDPTYGASTTKSSTKGSTTGGGCSAGGGTKMSKRSLTGQVTNQSVNFMKSSATLYDETQKSVLREVKAPKFDMATKWGENIESKVVNVEFEKGVMIFSQDIFYASRKSLIQMGIPLDNRQQVASTPQSFPGEYAKPPRGWRK